jgi:hypothetical protein
MRAHGCRIPKHIVGFERPPLIENREIPGKFLTHKNRARWASWCTVHHHPHQRRHHHSFSGLFRYFARQHHRYSSSPSIFVLLFVTVIILHRCLLIVFIDIIVRRVGRLFLTSFHDSLSFSLLVQNLVTLSDIVTVTPNARSLRMKKTFTRSVYIIYICITCKITHMQMRICITHKRRARLRERDNNVINVMLHRAQALAHFMPRRANTACGLLCFTIASKRC